MKLGNLGLRLEGIWRQESEGQDFVPFAEAKLKVTGMNAHAWSVALSAPRLRGNVAAVRLQLFVPGESLRIYHPALVRIFNRGSVSADEPFKDLPHSALADERHIRQAPGEQPFGMPPFLMARDVEWRYLIGALTENRARLSMAWTPAEGGLTITLDWRRQGQTSYASTKDWPNERIWIQWGPEPSFLDPQSEQQLQLLRDADRIAIRRRQLLERREQQFLAPYRKALHAALGQYSRTGPLVRDELMWGSWNDGIYRDIDQDRILQTSAWLKENAPNVRWIQIDDGWANPLSPGGRGPVNEENWGEGDFALRMSDLSAFYDPLPQDPRFPDGLAGLAKAIKANGQRPMLWITPAVHESSHLYREKPDWFQPETRLYFMPELRFLDTSVPEARTYIEKAFRTAFQDWGFEGCKLDFWTMGFDQPDIRFRDPNTDGQAEMRWFVQTLRRFLPPDGLLLHCIDLPFGSQFRSVGFDAFRYYADSEGSCQNLVQMKEQALWAAHLIGHYHSQEFWQPDGDGLGLFRHFEMPERHFELWLTFLVASGSLLEVAGWLGSALEPKNSLSLGGRGPVNEVNWGEGDFIRQSADPRLAKILAALPLVRHGAPLLLPDFDYWATDGEPPRVWVRAGRPFVIGLTNWWEEPMTIRLREVFMTSAPWTDVLTGEVFEPGSAVEVAPEHGRLLRLGRW